MDRERAGRAILYARIPAWQFADDPEGFARCIWYIPHSILRDDPDLQKRGVVIVSDMRGAWKASALQTMQYLHSVKYLTDNFVHHLVSTHMLYDDPTLDSLIRAIRAFQDKRDRRLRYRMHFGSSIEIGYSLRTYGIDLSDCLDLDRNFEDNDSCPLSRSTVEQKVRQQIQRDEAWRTKEAESSIVRLPKRNDVILGRGIHASTWPGTLLYYKIIAEEAHVYAAAGSSDEGDLGHDRHNKTMVVDGTIQRMQSQYHMRFLSRQETHWTIAPYLEIRAKVGSALRKEARFLATP